MIYSVLDNYSSSSNSYEANSKYYGAGAFNFMSECARDELEIFENAITTDMHEVVLGESSYEMEAINEGFFENVWKKIKEIFKKFIEWIKAVTRSAVAKLANLLIRDNKEFAKFARKKINAMKNRGKFEYNGTVLKANILSTDPTEVKTLDAYFKETDQLAKLIEQLDSRTLSNFSKEKVTAAENTQSKINELSVSETLDNNTDDATDAKISVVMDHLKFLEKLSKQSIDKVRKNLKKFESTADKAIKKAEKLERDTEDKDKYKDDKTVYSQRKTKDAEGNETGEDVAMGHADAKTYAANAVTICNIYKSCAQSITTFQLSLIKSYAKVARTVVAKAAGATPKNEGYYDEELLDAMNEAVLYEYDEALESTDESKGSEKDTENLDDPNEENED